MCATRWLSNTIMTLQMNCNWPEVIMLFLMVLSLGIAISEHGKPKTGKNSFWATLIGQALSFALLYWGGFFS